MKFVDNVKESWKWFSMQSMTLAMAVQGTWMTIPEELKNEVPKNLVHWITLILVVAGIFGRLIKQSDLK